MSDDLTKKLYARIHKLEKLLSEKNDIIEDLKRKIKLLRASADDVILSENARLSVDCEWFATNAEEEEERATEVHGILAEICDIVFEDSERADIHGYKDVVERCKQLVEEKNGISV